MSDFKRDPKGYYSMLDVPASADTAAIKTAYRNKAKRLHPDINPSPIAAKQFQRLTEAYEILSDNQRRVSYDQSTPSAKIDNTSKDKTKDKAEEKTETRSQDQSKASAYYSKRSQTERASEPQSSWSSKEKETYASSSQAYSNADTAKATDIQPEACQCGRVTAQPRYVIFDIVLGQITRIKYKTIAGVFCRNCAEKAAIKASCITWIGGWWAWPNGPKETIKALWSNIRGGRQPTDRNARLLMRQAKAFRDRGDAKLARGIAEQALVYARAPELRREMDILLLSLSAHSAQHLKTRWEKPSWSYLVQLSPLMLLILWLSLFITLSTPVSITEWVQDQATQFLGSGSSQKLRVGSRAEVVTSALNFRTGPDNEYEVLLTLTKGAIVTITEIASDSNWARVETLSNELGFVPLHALEPLEEIPKFELTNER